ncbi:AAA family ATPase [Phytomonospora sp. NPDC050363]|uniref:AAA family ATPase n=1 Tax=Phytomonospora sp. NPDC050363 TaxID=3155642 RepID=UPI0033D70E61
MVRSVHRTAATVTRPHVHAAVRRGIDEAGAVLLTGPAGSGKSTVLAALGENGERVVRLSPAARDREVPYATITELLSALPTAAVDALAPPRRSAVRVLLRQEPGDGTDHLAVRLAVTELLSAADGRALLLLDNAADVDDESADVLDYVRQHAPEGRVGLVAARREADDTSRVLSGAVEIAVPPWDLDEISALLAGHGIPTRLTGRVFRACGGNPQLAVRLGGALGGWRRGDPAMPIPETARRPIRAQLATLSASARQTLLHVALAAVPSLSLLARAGRPDAREDLAETSDAGLTTLGSDGRIALSSGAVGDTVREAAGSAELSTVHAALAAVADDPVTAVWHRAHVASTPSADLAAELDAAADTLRARGARRRAAALSFLAAELTPGSDQAGMQRRFVTAAGDAGLGGDVELTRRAAALILDRVGDPALRVSVLTAVIESAGQALDSIDDVFADLTEAAAEDPALMAVAHLWMAWRYYICEGDSHRAFQEATTAHRLAVRGGNVGAEIEGLTTAARLGRALGRSETEELLERAAALDPDASVGALRDSALFVRSRHAFFDDDLDAARRGNLTLLPLAQRRGDIKDLSDVYRTLAEVELRAGRCTLALDYIRQATERLTDTDTSTATVWYVVALAETGGGDLARAASFARQGLRSAHEDHDVLFTSRCLYALGRVQLFGGETAAAAQTLREVRAFEAAFDIADPSILQWHRELAEALAATGEIGEAAALVRDARKAAETHGRDNVLPGLDHADAVCLLESGDPEGAATLFDRARRRFAELGLPLEEGRTLLSLARLERRRRRRAAARALLTEAAAIFERCDALPWIALTEGERARLDNTGPSSAAALTDAESRLAALVAGGATNTEAAAQLFVSVKTVEATLTRVYRKLGLRSRAQLAARLSEPR